MSLISTDHSESNSSLGYDSIFQHYGLDEQKSYLSDERTFETKSSIIERNDNKKTKKIHAKTVKKTHQHSEAHHAPGKHVKHGHHHHHHSKIKTKDHDKVIKIPVPPSGKARKASYTGSTTAKPVPSVEMHRTSDSTIKSAQRLPSYHSQTSHTSANPNQLLPPHAQAKSHRSETDKTVPVPLKVVHEHDPLWDLHEINRFTRDIFKFKHGTLLPGGHPKAENHRFRVRLICPDDENLETYIKSRFNCVDIFDEYVNLIKKQYGVVRDAANDPATFDPGITIIGPQVKKDSEVIDREDSQAIKKIRSMEPRKKYALVHENVGIFIIGGYNLLVDVPVQKEPEVDYLFKSNGSVTRIPTLHPSRCNFAVYADGEAIYVAGGQTIHNELLDDIQRLNIKTLKWEPVATLLNPVAASGMTIENGRIYLIGGYDIILSQTAILEDYIIYNLSTNQFEKADDLPSPRCRSLVFATDNAIFCVSGLTDSPNDNKNKKFKICTDILKWSHQQPTWNKVSQTPELSKFHALSFNDPYLEITKRSLDGAEDGDFTTEAYYDFRTNTWAKGKAPEHRPHNPPKQSEAEHPIAEKPAKSAAPHSPTKKHSPSKHKSAKKSKKHTKSTKNKTKHKKSK